MKRVLVIATMALALAVVGVRSAGASTVRMQLTDGTTTVTINDNNLPAPGTGTDSNGTLGIINWSGTIGLWTVTVTSGTGENQLLTGPGGMDLSFNVATATGTSTTLTVLFTQFDMSPSYPAWNGAIDGNATGGIHVVYSAFESNTNTPFALTNSLGTTASLGPGSYHGTVGGSVGAIPLYSLTQRIQFTQTGATGGTTGDALLLPVPEPGSMLLLGSGLLGLAAVARRRARKA